MVKELIHQGENLEFIKTLQSESIDLIYNDILYGTKRDFDDYQDLRNSNLDIDEFYLPRIAEMHRILKPTGSRKNFTGLFKIRCP